MSKLKTFLIFVSAFAISIILIYLVAKNINDFELVLKKTGIFAPIVAVLIYGILSVTPIPTDPLTLACGALFGPVWGIFISWMGNNFAALIEYVIGRGAGDVTSFESKKNKLPFGLGNLPADSPVFLILGRFVPGFGSKIVSVLAGVYKVSVWRYLWTAAVANIVGSVLYVLGGFGLFTIIK